MADITNPQAVRFCNDKARTLADLLGRVDRTIPEFLLDVVQDFEATTGGNQNTDTVADGSALDGRNPVTKSNVAELKFVMEKVKECLDTDDRRALLNKWVVNGQPIY